MVKFFTTLKDLYLIHLTNKTYNKYLYYFAIFLSTILAIVEILGISAIGPLAASFFDENFLIKNIFFQKFIKYFDIDSENYKVFFTVIFLSFFILSNILIIITGYVNYFLAFSTTKKQSLRLFESYLNSEIKFLNKKNISDLLTELSAESDRVSHCTVAYILFLSKSIVLFTITLFATLFFFEIFLFAFVGIILVIFIYYIVSKRLKKISKTITSANKSLVENANQSIMGYLETITYSLQQIYKNNFINSSKVFINNQTNLHLISLLPRYALELLFIIGAIGGILYLSKSNEMISFLPKLSMLLFIAYRMLPLMSQLLYQIARVKGYNYALVNIDNKIKEAENNPIFLNEDSININFTNNLKIKNIIIDYGKKILKQREDIQIKKGDKIYLKGESGSGKTTLINLICGVLKPDNGQVLSDNININTNINNWLKNISYVPQKSFLFHENLKYNICFKTELDSVSEEKYKKILNLLDFSSFLEVSKTENFQIYSDGANLSGGQRQKIAIARALFHDPQILIFDESFNALNKEQEELILENILSNYNNLTILMTSHREINKKYYNRIINISDIF